MKISFLLLTNFVTLSILAQLVPKLNPLVDLHKSKTLDQLVSSLKKNRDFKLIAYHDTLIIGMYQNQAIEISKAEAGLDTPDSSFLVIISFKSKKDFETFLAAGRIFFSQTGSDFQHNIISKFSCDNEIFEKRDFKPFLLKVIYSRCSTDMNKMIYQLSLKPYSMNQCGIE